MKGHVLGGYLLLAFTDVLGSAYVEKDKFPEDFLFGVSTSAYQIEGAWNVSGKAESIWDRLTHSYPEMIQDSSNADIACNSYHMNKEDVALLKNLGVHLYRFSLSWSRIMPSPLTNKVNEDGIRYYNELIDLLIQNGIQPLVTLYHWDLPQLLQDLGGFTNSLVIESFVAYARVAFEKFGDRVKLWVTFNQPKTFCLQGYGDIELAPAMNLAGIAEYMCGHNVLKAHAKVYHLYNNTFKPKQQGRISISVDSAWYEPFSDSLEDMNSADRALQFTFGWYAHPIFSKEGNYPALVKQRIAKRSQEEGFRRSRLPQFTKEESDYIRGTHDFFALNHYRTFLAADRKPDPYDTPSFYKDMNVNYTFDPSWPGTGSPHNKVVPWGFSKLLKWIKEEFEDPEIYVTENGFEDTGQLDDLGRIEYFKLYLNALLESIHKHGVRVKAYTAWSLMDNYEWNYGYISKYGFYHVDFSNPNRTRTPKASAAYFKQLIATRTLQ